MDPITKRLIDQIDKLVTSPREIRRLYSADQVAEVEELMNMAPYPGDPLEEAGRVPTFPPDEASAVKFYFQGQTIIEKACPTARHYLETWKHHKEEIVNRPFKGLNKATQILISVKEELQCGLLFDIRSLLSGEIFSDFLEMADHLLETNYKDPAAVILGAVLEEHLRQLCLKNEILLEKIENGRTKYLSAAQMNDSLYKKQVYNLIDHRLIFAMYAIRNNAAHGKFDEYSSDQVENMKNDLLSFISRNP